MNDSPGARRGGGDPLSVLDPRDQRLFAQRVEARIERTLDQRRMTARRRADVDEIERFAG